jgi:hypothetical protein
VIFRDEGPLACPHHQAIAQLAHLMSQFI